MSKFVYPHNIPLGCLLVATAATVHTDFLSTFLHTQTLMLPCCKRRKYMILYYSYRHLLVCTCAPFASINSLAASPTTRGLARFCCTFHSTPRSRSTSLAWCHCRTSSALNSRLRLRYENRNILACLPPPCASAIYALPRSVTLEVCGHALEPPINFRLNQKDVKVFAQHIRFHTDLLVLLLCFSMSFFFKCIYSFVSCMTCTITSFFFFA